MSIFPVLIVLWALLLFGGFLTGNFNPEETHRIPTPARMGASFVLVLFAWAWFLFATPEQSPVFQNLALYLAIGMTCGFIGDLFMAKNIVPGGISAFGIGHLFYIAGLIQTANTLALTDYRPISLVIFWIVGIILWYIVVFQGADKPGILHYVALPYALLLASTAGLAAGIALQDSAFILIAIGAFLFLLSDLLLAAELFNELHFRGIGDAVWLLYSPGQMLIVTGLFFSNLLI